MKPGAHVVVPGISMRVDMHHSHRTARPDRAEDGPGDRMVATDRYWNDALIHDLPVERLDFPQRTDKFIRAFDPAIPKVADTQVRKRFLLGCRIDGSQQA